MKRTLLVLLSMCLFIVPLSGCTAELYERLLISAVGVDLSEDGYTVTVRAPETVENGVEKSYESRGKTVPEALNRLSRETGKKPLYSHNTLVVFGKSCAEAGLLKPLDFFIRHYESRPNIRVFMAEADAAAVLSGETDAEGLLSLSKSGVYGGDAVDTTLVAFVNGARGKGTSAVLPVLKAEEGGVSLSGTAIFREDALHTIIDAKETRGLLALCGTLSAGDFVISDEHYGDVNLTVWNVGRSLRFVPDKKSPRFEIELQIEGEIGSVSRNAGAVEADAFRTFEKALSAAVLEEVSAYLASSVFAGVGESAGLSVAAERSAPKLWREISDHDAFLKNAVCHVTVKSRIARVEEENLPYF